MKDNTLKCHTTEFYITRRKLTADISLLILLFLFYAMEILTSSKLQGMTNALFF